MLSAMILAISTVALAQFGVFYWRAVIIGVAAEPISERVLEAAQVSGGRLSARDFGALAELHELTPDLQSSHRGLGLVRFYYKLMQLVETACGSRVPAVAAWADKESLICARYAAVLIDRRLEANLALAASIRSC
jgi:hypothetical protein